eukprot:gi/632953668/ref/XP_007892549.1/ PREDICTED: ninein-like protein isoform X3 [Callorhinchus milii]
MDESEQNKYVSQLKEVFNSCDTTGTGYLDKEELTELCRKLHLEAQLPLLLQSLLGVDLYARVNFEEFKEGFVAVLSTSIDLSTSGDESSYLEPMVPEEVQPKYVKGSKRYGRRSVPEFLDSEVETTGDLEEPVPFKTAKAEPGLQGTSRSQLRRSTSLESVESLKSDEEAESNKEPPHETFEAQGQMSMWNPDGFDSPTRSSTPYPDATENHVQAIWKELGVGKSGFLNKQELATVCDNIGLKDLDGEEVDDLFKKLDKDCDGKVSLNEFLHGLFRHGPQELAASSSSYKQKYRRALHQAFDESGCRTATPSFISNLVGSRLFSSLDDGTGYVSPEQVVNIWQEDGIKSSQEILQTLDFNMEEKVNLTELTIALDNELLVSNNGIYQAALSSYKNEIGYLQGQVEQSNKERDKIKSDLDRAEKRNLQLAREVDDHHTTMELLNESKFKDLDQEYKDKVAAVKTEMDKEQELVVQQVNKQRAKLEQEVDSLRSEEILLRDRLNLAIKENGRLEKEVGEVVEKLRNSEKLVCRLQKDLDYVLKEKFGTLDLPSTEYFGQEERFAEIVKEYEQQCRELRDQNDELQSEVEILRSQLHERKNHRTRNVRDKSVRVRADGRITTSQSDSAQTSGSPDVSIEAEMAIEQLRDQHKQEVQDLKIQLETKVNYYEREVELMKRGFEKERRDIEQSFKIEISELEEQMERLQGLVSDLRNQQKEAEAKHQDIVSELQREREEERTNPKEELGKNHEKNLRMNTEELKMSLLRSGGLSNRSQADAETRLRLQELEKAFSLERTDMEEQFAKEISEREQKLVNEKEQLEKDLMNQHQQELNKLRYESKMLAEENLSLKRKLERIHMEFQDLDRERSKQRKQMEQLKGEKDRAEEEAKGLENVNDQSKAEMAELRSRILHLSSENSQFSAKLETSQNAIQLLNNRLAEHSQQTEEPVVSAKLLQATSCQREQEQQSIWEEKMELMEKELGIMREKVLEQSSQASEAGALRAEKEDLERRCQTLTQHFQETKEKTKDLEAALEGAHSEADHLKSVLTATQLDTLSLTQEMGSLRKALQEDRDKMSRMHILESELEAVRQECQTVQSTRVQLEAALVEIQEQLLDTKARLMLAKSQHVSQEQQLKEHISTAVSKDQLVQLQIKLSEEKERATQLQEQLDTQTQEANKLMFEQQVEYEQLLKRMEERMEQVEYKLKGVRIILREKMNQLKEQLTKNTKSDLLLKDLYLENSQLMKALQVTEHRQKSAEKNNFLLDEKIAALNKLIRKIAPMSLS